MLRPLSSLLDQVRPPPDRGSTVEVHSTPFGCEVFLNAVTRGSICGVVGKRPSLLLTDAATALGSEGGPVFTEGPTKELIGCVVCSVSWWRGEWVGLTLTAPLVSVLSAKLRVNAAPARSLASHPHREILESIDKSTVLVRCGAAWGAGVYLGAGYVLTCAHVVRNYTISKVSIYCDGVQQTGIVRYKTADDKAFDLALLYTNPEQWTHLKAARLTSSAAEKGDSVLAAGYPYFNETNLDHLRPTVTTGHVNNTSPSMIQTSCCVQSGFSGGPIFRLTKDMHVEVIAIIVSNAKTQTGACYPYINMAVPAAVFKQLIKDFITDKGLEVYSEFCGYCLATGNAIRKGKLEIGLDSIAMARKGHLTRAVFGSNGIELCRVMEEELAYMGTGDASRPKFPIDEMLPEEAEKAETDRQLAEEAFEAAERLRTLTLAARKRRVCTRLSRHVGRLNFILFWPHNHQAHYDLYEKWDMINIQVGAKDTIQLKEEDLAEVLYMSDVDANEACIHALLDGECLVVQFKMFETDTRDFVKLLRYTLYEEIPIPKEDVPPEKQVPPIPAFERYASISKTHRQVRRDRYNAKLQKMREEKEEAERLAAEQARMERLAEEDRLAAEKQRKEEEKLARIQAGLPAEEPVPEPEPVVEGEEKEGAETEGTETIPVEELEEEKVEAEEEFNSDIEVEGEDYIPPGGLFVPGLYAPPNELAKSNGLAFFYPKHIANMAPVESEYLPPHVLVMFPVDKREDVKEIIKPFQNEILAMGVFVGEDLATAEHIAYSIKQYNKMERRLRHKDRLALMVSRKRSLPLLQLAGLNPFFISADVSSGERDCLQLFPVGYGDEFEEEESIVEEEIQEVVLVPESSEPEPVVEDQPEDEDEDEDED